MNQQRQRLLAWNLPGPGDDEVDHIRVEISFMEWSRIDRVEQMRYRSDANLDDRVVRWDRITDGGGFHDGHCMLTE